MHKSTNHLIRLLFTVFLLCGPHFTFVPSVHAQNDAPVYCQTLSADDCALVVRSQEAMTALTAATMAIDIDMLVSDIPDAPFDTLDMQIQQKTAFAVTPDGVAARERMQQMLAAETSSRLTDPTQLAQLFVDLLNGTQMDTNLTFTVSDDIIRLIEEEAAASGEPIPFALPNSFSFAGRVVNGIGFTRFSDFFALMPGMRVNGEIWFGMDYGELIDFAVADGAFDNLTQSDLEAVDLLLTLYSGNSMSAGGPLAATMADIPYAAEVAPFLQLERLADETQDGRAVARIRTTVDYARLLADPQVQELLSDYLRDNGLNGEEMSEAEIAQMVALAQFAGPAILESLGLEAIESIDLENGYVLNGELHLNWDLSQLMALAGMAGADVPEMEELPVITLNVASQYDNFNEPALVTEPETALIVSFGELLRLAELSN